MKNEKEPQTTPKTPVYIQSIKEGIENARRNSIEHTPNEMQGQQVTEHPTKITDTKKSKHYKNYPTYTQPQTKMYKKSENPKIKDPIYTVPAPTCDISEAPKKTKESKKSYTETFKEDLNKIKEKAEEWSHSHNMK